MGMRRVVIFGEAERGRFVTPYHLRDLSLLFDILGNPPKQSQGIFFAIQTILKKYEALFFRVSEEGFSIKDYLLGLKLLKKGKIGDLSAVAIPGVGNLKIVEETAKVCLVCKTILIISERDLYDYLTT